MNQAEAWHCYLYQIVRGFRDRPKPTSYWIYCTRMLLPKPITLTFLLFVVFSTGTLSANDSTVTKPEKRSITYLENRIAEIDDETRQLAEYSLRSGVGPVGYRSHAHRKANTLEWIQIELEKATLIDEIILVPTIWREMINGLRADGFPAAFNIFAGTDENEIGEQVATYTPADISLPRIAPLLVPIPPTRASWVRIEVTTLSPRIWDGLHVLQLSEILILSGEENVALHRPVKISSNQNATSFARSKEYLVDGFVPYLMNAPIGEKSLAFTSQPGIVDQPTLTIDLGENIPVDRIHLHGPDLSDTVPQALPDDYGIARRWLIEGATQADFSDAKTLFEYKMDSIYDVGPIIMWKFPKTTVRYVRLVATKPFIGQDDRSTGPQIALAEIEIFSNGNNIALGKSIVPNFRKISKERSLASLTDGRNFYGKILPTRLWLEQLARRHDLETERPLVLASLNEHYAEQKRVLVLMAWLAGALTVGIIITVLVDRIIRLRHVAGIKERFAADLHDELGANVHTIGLLSDLASNSFDSLEDLQAINTRIRQLTERTGTAIRHCTNMMEAKGLYFGLVDDIRRTAKRNIALLEHDITIEGEEHIEKLKPRTRVDLYLFYKECLINVCRHSGAKKFATRLIAEPNKLSLTISDNGKGLPDRTENWIPSSLSRRARLLRAKLSVKTVPNEGTSITLKLKTKRFGFRI